jgi:hypothetical protein
VVQRRADTNSVRSTQGMIHERYKQLAERLDIGIVA